MTACYWALLCVATHLPPRYVPRLGIDDKVEHFVAYGMLAGLLGLTLWATFPRRPWLVWVVLLGGMAYGAIDEQTQPYFGRTCDLDDWIADVVGTTAGLLPVLLLQRFVRIAPAVSRKPRADVLPLGDTLGAELEAALNAYDVEPASRPEVRYRARRAG